MLVCNIITFALQKKTLMVMIPNRAQTLLQQDLNRLRTESRGLGQSRRISGNSLQFEGWVDEAFVADTVIDQPNRHSYVMEYNYQKDILLAQASSWPDATQMF